MSGSHRRNKSASSSESKDFFQSNMDWLSSIKRKRLEFFKNFEKNLDFLSKRNSRICRNGERFSRQPTSCWQPTHHNEIRNFIRNKSLDFFKTLIYFLIKRFENFCNQLKKSLLSDSAKHHGLHRNLLWKELSWISNWRYWWKT